MALETKLFQKMTQQLVMTPQLRQAIKILQVSRTELETLIDEELCENPVLEDHAEVAEERVTADLAPEAPRVDGVVGEIDAAPAPEKTREESAKDIADIDWRDYFENYGGEFHGATVNESDSGDDDRRPTVENVLTRSPDLVDHLLWQLRLSSLSEAAEQLGELLIGNLDRDGYLKTSVEEIANLAAIPPEEVEAVLLKIQEFDPPGVAARDLRECLLIQLNQVGAGSSLAATIIRDHLGALESRRFEKLAKDLGVTVELVVEASKVIGALEPKPGRNFGDGDIRYVTPDVYITKVGEEYVITLNDDGLPRLRVSQTYMKMLSNDPSGEAKGYIQDKMRAASWLIKSIHQRQRTIYLVTQSIVKFQRDFFERGVSGLKPLVLKDVANDIGMHESTVSRATSNKYVHTPQGTFELKFFFTSSLHAAAGEDVSSESVKQRIREIISAEDQKHPYSDQYIAAMLAKENVDIARRTVAKYREMMGILPSSKRKQPY
jgi:RNA polymerase sigma-54 factor